MYLNILSHALTTIHEEVHVFSSTTIHHTTTNTIDFNNTFSHLSIIIKENIITTINYNNGKKYFYILLLIKLILCHALFYLQ